ncbi:GNAT family N-acetyltransferase [Sedimentibacter hydroxybenzoicus DSM 7310]|uniref:GNAT family N-acetyltransferase n=1 Tax=Sedimentibacter hydroxybenzoicus DSM 7310 TaxID=1123245 RepID=A0A974BMB4_SEDHY|nr:GNAT family N-acetyltransferase [Sedimentibacter hydroxybenzoicus]NYB75476.1 GNAT family N-acetyltransferase [Sedimentibacter hydroxybenzoicus DSM 7310]
MFFELKDFCIDLVESKDLDEIAEVYNSNKQFLKSHMNRERVTNEWILQELESMKKSGFYSCKIVEIKSGEIIGIIDFKAGEEVYLSLLMLKDNFKGKGFGNLIFQYFEEYAKSQKSKCIRIDVVTDYDNSVLDFWINNGFAKVEDIELNWTEKILPAVVMRKYI